VAGKCRRIQSIEAAGNEAYREIVRQLSLTLIRPFDRDDIHELSLAQETVLNRIRALSSRLGLYGFTSVKSAGRDLVSRLVELAAATGRMFQDLNSTATVQAAAEEVERIRTETEMLLVVALGEAYESPAQRPEDILEIIKWAQIYDRLEETINGIEHIATIVKSIVLKNV